MPSSSTATTEDHPASLDPAIELSLLKRQQERLQKALTVQTESFRNGIQDLLG